MKVVTLVMLLLGLLLLPGHFTSAAVSGLPGIGARFLDLPDGFSVSEDEEDEPELIPFYANEYEGDAWIFVLDKSDSMKELASNGQPKYVVRNRETIKAIQAMSGRSVACVIFYDHKRMQSDTYGDPPIRTDAAGKAFLIARVAATRTADYQGSDSCICAGITKGLMIANKTNNEHRVLMVVADGRAQCAGDINDPDVIFQRVMALNTLRLPINTVYTGETSGPDWEQGARLLKRLSQATNGKFKIAQ